MGGEPGTYLVRWAPRHALPEGYEVVWVDGLYYWQNRDRDYGGESVNRWRVRREAIAHFHAKQGQH